MRIPAPKRATWLAIAAAVLLAGGCADVPAGWRAEPSGDLIYAPLNLHFAPRFEDLVRGQVHTYDAQGADVSVGYDQPLEKLTLTLYFYPRPKDTEPETEFKAVLAAIVHSLPGARVEMAKRGPIDLGGQKTPGFLGFVVFRDDETDWASYVWVIPAGERFVKLRTSIPRGDTEKPLQRAFEVSTRLLASLSLAVP